MENPYIQGYKKIHMIHKTLPTYKHDYTENLDTQFRPLQETVAYETYFVDPQYGLDPYWDQNFYNQDKLEYKDTYNTPNEQIEREDLNTDAHVSDALRYVLIDLWTVNPPLLGTSSLPNFQPRLKNQQRQFALIDDQILRPLHGTPDALIRFLTLSTKLPIKNKRKTLNFLMDNGELKIDGFINTGALSSANPKADLRMIWLLAPHIKMNEGPSPEFQFMVANGQVEASIETVDLQFELSDIIFRETFIIMTNLTKPLLGLLFLQRNNTIIFLSVKES